MTVLHEMKQKLLTLNPLAVFYYFCLTVIFVRAGIVISISLEHIPAIYVRGWHMHHFVFGFLCLFLVLDEFGRRKKMPRWMAELLLGLSLGLIFDEFAFWAMAHFEYWSMSNFYAAAFLSISAGLLSRVNRRPYHINFRHKVTKKTTQLISNYSFPRQVILPWASFVSILFLLFYFN